jgi:predicted DsbA family dithiol-disulfide isomerase
MEEAGKGLGIELTRPWIVPWSRKAHELAFLARKGGCFQEIHDTLFRAYLSEGVDIGRVDVLVELARRHGLDPMETKASLDVDLHRESVLKRRKDALDAGVTRPPALLWRQGRSLDGCPDDQTLREFLALNGRQET